MRNKQRDRRDKRQERPRREREREREREMGWRQDDGEEDQGIKRFLG